MTSKNSDDLVNPLADENTIELTPILANNLVIPNGNNDGTYTVPPFIQVNTHLKLNIISKTFKFSLNITFRLYQKPLELQFHRC